MWWAREKETKRVKREKKWFDGSDENHRSIRNGIYGIEYKVISHFMFEPFRRPFNPSVPSLFETCFANIFRIPFVLSPTTQHARTQTHTSMYSIYCICVLYACMMYVLYKSISIIFFPCLCFFPSNFSRAEQK